MATLEAIGIIQGNALASIENSCAILSQELGIAPIQLPLRGQMEARLHHARTLEAFALTLAEITGALSSGATIGQDDAPDYENETVEDLKKMAEILGKEVPSRISKPKLIALIRGEDNGDAE